MKKYEYIQTKQEGELLLVTLHRPDKHNAMTHQMRVDLMDCARKAEADDTVRAIIFTGMATNPSALAPTSQNSRNGPYPLKWGRKQY